MGSPSRLSQETEQEIRDAWDKGIGLAEACRHFEGRVSRRQLERRFESFQEDKSLIAPTEEQREALTELLTSGTLSSDERLILALRLMELHIVRVHTAASQPRKVAVDLRSERLLSESLERYMRALKETPFEVDDAG